MTVTPLGVPSLREQEAFYAVISSMSLLQFPAEHLVGQSLLLLTAEQSPDSVEVSDAQRINAFFPMSCTQPWQTADTILDV